MKFLSKSQIDQLLQNGAEQNRDKDHHPVVKLYLPGTNCTWLLTEIDPDEPTIAFGLCDLGMGFPELGYVSLQELENVTIQGICKVDYDRHFIARYPISIYAKAARMNEGITEDEKILKQFAS